MRVVIISDIHANYAALSMFRETWDELWVVGDLVNYGPNPREVIEWVRKHAHVVVRGNHDHAIGFSREARCSAPYKVMAAETGAYTHSILDDADKRYLELLPLSVERRLGKQTFYICHAIPSDPLFGYKPKDDPSWVQELKSINADILVVGHTHVPFVLDVGSQRVINPGSIGQPKTGNSEACYGVWEDGKLELKSFAYRVDEIETAIWAMPISYEVKEDLIFALYSGGELRRGGQ